MSSYGKSNRECNLGRLRALATPVREKVGSSPIQSELCRLLRTCSFVDYQQRNSLVEAMDPYQLPPRDAGAG